MCEEKRFFVTFAQKFSMMKYFFRIFSLLLFCAVSLSCVDDEESAYGQEFLVDGDVLPSFVVETITGETISSEMLSERPCVLVFFHTGCGDCRRELPIINDLYEEFSSEVNFLCIARQQGADEVGSYWEEAKLSLPVAPQENRNIYNLFAERGIPRVYVCEAGGRISKRFTERVGKKKLRKAIEGVLNR